MNKSLIASLAVLLGIVCGAFLLSVEDRSVLEDRLLTKEHQAEDVDTTFSLRGSSRQLSHGRPIYVMAHRCNTKSWFDHAVKWGANGIEVDITKQSGTMWSWHGDTGGWDKASNWVDHAGRALQRGNGKKVSVLIFDLKYDVKQRITYHDINWLRKIVKQKILDPINKGRTDRKGIHVFFGVYEGAKYEGEFVKAIKAMPLGLNEGVNFDAGLDKKDPHHALTWKKQNNIQNFIYSSGIFMAGIRSTMWKQLTSAANQRHTTPFGVYAWTFGKAWSAASAIKHYKLDGVLGNMDQKFGWLPTHLKHYQLYGYWLASREDYPPFLKKY